MVNAREIISKWPQFRLVKFDNLPRVMAMAMSYKWLFHLGLKGMIHPKQNGFISVLLTGISGHKCGKDVPIEPARTWKHEGPLLIFMATWV